MKSYKDYMGRIALNEHTRQKILERMRAAHDGHEQNRQSTPAARQDTREPSRVGRFFAVTAACITIAVMIGVVYHYRPLTENPGVVPPVSAVSPWLDNSPQPTPPVPADEPWRAAYQAVLLDGAEFFDAYTQQNTSLSEANTAYHELAYIRTFTVIDLDDDSIPEVILTRSISKDNDVGVVILRDNDRVIYGYELTYRQFHDLKADGTYRVSMSAGDWAFGCRMNFEENTWHNDRFAYSEAQYDTDGFASVSYTLNGEIVTEDVFLSAFDAQNAKPDAVWYEFTEENVETVLSAYTPQASPYTPADSMLIYNTSQCDFDGDGTRETVTIACVDDDYGTAFAECSGGSVAFRETLILESFANIKQTISIDLDGDGGEELIVVADTGGQGGWGGRSLVVLTLDGNSVKQLHAGDLCGFSVTGNLLPNFQAQITVAETGGTITFSLSENEVYLAKDMNYYSEDGELLKDTEVYGDAICYVAVNPESGVVEIGQFLWAFFHASGEEFLVTELSFDKDGYTVISQRVETYEYAQLFLGDLSKFAGVYANANGDTVTLKTDGTLHEDYTENGVIYKEKARNFRKQEDGGYRWGVNLENYDGANGYSVWLYPVGVEVYYGGSFIATDTTKPRLYAGHDFDPDMTGRIYYLQQE